MSEVIKFGRKNKVYEEFSNFSKGRVIFEDLEFENVEAAFQAAKTLDKKDRVRFTKMSGMIAKREGRKVKLRPDWEEVKEDVMYQCIKSRVYLNPDFCKLLLSTKGKRLMEDTTGWHDNIWGQCSCPKCYMVIGKNLLGKTYMRVRDEILEQYNL